MREINPEANDEQRLRLCPRNLANLPAAKRQGRRRPPVFAGELSLIGAAAMFDAIGKARVHRFAAEMEIRLARMAHRPFADALREIEQARLVLIFGVELLWHQPARRRRR